MKIFLTLFCLLAGGQLAHAETIKGWVLDSAGERLRTFVTRPSGVQGKVPAIVFVGWLSCDSMEYAKGEEDGFGALMLRLIDQSGYATLRMDKPGVGESQGNCAKADFASELSGWKAAFDSLKTYPFIDLDRIFVIGISNGGGFAPLAAEGHKVRGFVAASSWGRTWYEHMIEHERRRLTAAGKSAADINEAMRGFAQFYDLYLDQGMTPGEALAKHPEWKSLWYDKPEGQYGRPAAFYQQLQALNLGRVWQSVEAPVLVVYGTGDMVMSRADSDAIGQIVNGVHPGAATDLTVEGMTHLFEKDGKFYAPLVPAVLDWMKRQK